MIQALINEMKSRGMNKCAKTCHRGWESDFLNIILIYSLTPSNALDRHVCHSSFKWKKTNKSPMLHTSTSRHRVAKEKDV